MERRLIPAVGRLALGLALGLTLLAAPARGQGLSGPDTGTGCMAIGDGPVPTVVHCEYLAPDESQNVLAATPSPWKIYVVRCCSKADPTQCQAVLGENGGPPDPFDFNCFEPRDALGKPINKPVTVVLEQAEGAAVTTVEPIPGEQVTVFMGSGAVGLVSAGQDEAAAQ